MDRQKINVLIIDDHPLIAEAYKKALEIVSDENSDIKITIDLADSCELAYFKIKENAKLEKNYDLVFLDIKLPPSTKNKILSGEDLGIEIKAILPNTKIIISTTFDDNYRIHSLFKSVDPNGFLIKNDVSSDELITAIKTILSGSLYYSKTVLKLLRKEVSNDFILDKIDRSLLFELSQGTKTKDLPNFIPLSIAGIEKRKRLLKEIFNISKSDDRTLISVAREKGFI
ncbi:response regulator [Winogradskyella sp.]|uniref:response regulator n=1 Tax=Winogradskyella sp. TaxID=1883156 RepID=UPI003AB4B8AA